MKSIIKKLKNPIVISSILSTIFMILSGLDIINITDSKINIIINSIMSILTILGVLNAPYKKANSKRKKIKK